MNIESIRVQGFRSLGDLTFSPKPFTVLVGPNNAGKSNIVDALGFLSDIYAHGVKHAIDVRGGFENIAFREDGFPRQEISLEVVVSANLAEIRLPPPTRPYPGQDGENWFQRDHVVRLQHSFTLHGTGEPLFSEFNVREEAIRIDHLRSDASSLVLQVWRNGADADIEFSTYKALRWLALPYFQGSEAEEFLSRVAKIEGPSTDLVVRRLRELSPLLWPFLKHLGTIRTNQLLPTSCRMPSSPTPEAELGHYGDNLSSLVYFLKDRYPQMWEIVLQDMRLISPDLDDIDVELTTDRRWTLVFKETGHGRRWTIDEVSDGTIRALALFSTVTIPVARCSPSKSRRTLSIPGSCVSSLPPAAAYRRGQIRSRLS